MIYALTFTGNVDPTAIATLILAVFTAASVVLGWRALKQTRSEIELARNEVVQSHRPVIVPILDEGLSYVIPAWGQVKARPVVNPSDGRLVVALKNIGSGPAIDILVTIGIRNDAGQPTEASGEHDGFATALGVGDIVGVVVTVPHLGGLPNFEIDIWYADVAGKHWRTLDRYIAADNGQYVEPVIKAVDPA